MTIKCNICGFNLTSLDIDKDRAVREVSNSLSLHLIKNHKEKVQEIQKATVYTSQQIVWFMLLTLAAKVPEDETYLLDTIEKNREELAKILGIEIVGNEEDCEIVDVEGDNNKSEPTKGIDGEKEEAD